MIDSYEAGKINEALKTFAQNTNNQSISMPAEVLGTDEDGTTWVQVIGGNEKTPLATSTVSLSEGDMVNVTIGNGRAEARGNLTDPSASGTSLRRVEARANEAFQGVGMAVQAGEAAQQAAAEAQEVAEAVNQHFWHRDTDPGDTAGAGAFVTDLPQEDFLEAIEQGIEPTEEQPLHNLLMNADGILLRAAKKWFASFTHSTVTFFDGLGNGVNNIVAQFGANLARIGKVSGKHVEITDTNGLELFDAGNSLAQFSATSARIGSMSTDHSFFDSTGIYFLPDGTNNKDDAFAWLSTYGDEKSGEVGINNGVKLRLSDIVDVDCINAANGSYINYTTSYPGGDFTTIYSSNGIELIAEDTIEVNGGIWAKGGAGTLFVGVGEAQVRHGIWSDTLGKWMCHANQTDIFLNGKNITSVAANRVFASPDGSSGEASFRQLVPTDVGLNRKSQTTVANVLTVSSDFTANNVTCLYTDVWAQLRTAIVTTNALTSGTNYSVATIKDAYKPYMGTVGGMYSGTNADVYVDGSAVIHVVPRANINADATLYISIPMYFLA